MKAQHGFASKFCKSARYHSIGAKMTFVALEICQTNFSLTPWAGQNVGQSMVCCLCYFISVPDVCNIRSTVIGFYGSSKGKLESKAYAYALDP
jgi:hypothetical protein